MSCKRCGDTGVVYARDGAIDCPCSVRADAELARLRAEVEALKDKARRFKGWRIVRTINGEECRSGLCTRNDARENVGMGRIVRVYRKAKR